MQADQSIHAHGFTMHTHRFANLVNAVTIAVLHFMFSEERGCLLLLCVVYEQS